MQREFLVSRRTLVVSALSGAAGLLLAVLLVAGAPAQASSPISASASSPATSVGQLSISFTAATAITGFTVHVITAHGTDVLDLPESAFTMTSGTTAPSMASSTWTLSRAITTSQLLLGSYSITVDATDGPDSVTGQPAGTLDYLIQPTVLLTASPAVLSYASPSATMSGTVTGLRPDGSTSPLVGQQVLVTNLKDGQSQRMQTDAEGDFNTSVSSPGTFTASVSGNTIFSASSSPDTVTAVTTPTQLTATAPLKPISYGQQVTVVGTLSYQTGTTLQGLGGMPVVIDAPGGYPRLSIPVTGADGSFTAAFTATDSGPVFVYFNNAQYQESGSFPYLAPAGAVVQITVDRPTSLTHFSATVASSRRVTVHGCVGVENLQAGSASSVPGTITIQYSARKAGPWHRLGEINGLKSAVGSSCGIATVEASYSGSFAAKLARAYYRATFVPHAGANLLGSVSAPVLAWKYPTRITGLKVSARHVAKGAKVTISGQLLQDTKQWVHYGHQLVQIVFRKPKAKKPYSIVKVTTDSAGKFTATFTDTFSATWSAFYPGNAKHFGCRSAGIRVTVS